MEAQPRTVLLTIYRTTLQKHEFIPVVPILSMENMSEYDLIPILDNTYNSARCRYKVINFVII